MTGDREKNRTHILHCLLTLGEATVQELAAAAGFSASAIFSHLEELEAEGLVTWTWKEGPGIRRAPKLYKYERTREDGQ